MLPQGERLLSQGEGTLSTTVAAPVATLALIKMVPLRFDAFPSTANHMNLLTPTILFLSPCTLFQLSPTLLTAHRPIIPRRKCRNNSLPSATSSKTNGFMTMTASPLSLLTCQLTRGTMDPTMSTSTTSLTLAYSLLAPRIRRQPRQKIPLLSTQPYEALSKLNGGKQCTTSSGRSW